MIYGEVVVTVDKEMYVFSQSYLQSASYEMRSGELLLHIEAYISIEHPGLNGIFDEPDDNEFEQFYRLIRVRFFGVQYIESIRPDLYGLSLKNDRGAIEAFEIVDATSFEPELALHPGGKSLISFAGNNQDLQIALFKSSSLAFQACFSELEITEID